MLNNRLVTIILALVVCLSASLCFADTAPEAENLSVTYTAQPVSMVVPQEVLVRLSLVFSDTRSIGNIRICREDGSVAANVNKDNITSGAPYVLSDTMIPTEKQLNNGIVVYAVCYTEDFDMPSAAEVEKKVEIRLEKLPAVPGIEFTRFAPHTLAAGDSSVSIIYKVCNNGNVAITNLFVSDVIVGEVARVDRLEPGERMSFAKNAAVTKNSVSIPKIVYSHAATSDSFSLELAPTAIYVAKENLRVSLAADADSVPRSGTVRLTCTVENNGGVSYSGITVYDEDIGMVLFPASVISPGEKYSFIKTVSVADDADFKYTLSAICETGEKITLDSNTVSVAVSEDAYEDVDISLKASLISIDGEDAKVELRLYNAGQAAIKSVRLSERSRGLFKTLFIVPPGETVLTRSFAYTRGDKLAFMAEVTDADGGMLTVLSNETAADENTPYVPAHEQPSVLPPAVLDGESLKIPDVYNTYTNMILLASLVLVVLIIIAILSMTLRKRKRKKREEERTKNVRRVFMRAGKGGDPGGVDSGDITLAVYGDLRKEKKGDLLNEKDRRPGSI